MRRVELFVIEGPKGRDFYGKGLKSKHVTDLNVYELVTIIKGLEENLNIVQVESTLTSSFLLNNCGQVRMWGINIKDQEIKYIETPIPMSGLSGIIIVALACGDQHILALESGMYLWTWGNNKYGQLGRDFSHEAKWSQPGRIPNINMIARITAGPNFSFAVNSQGTVFAWGDNTSRTLGLATEESYVCEPLNIEATPWNSEFSGQKSYFKTENIREIEYLGSTQKKIKAKQMENENLNVKISLLTKKFDFLEDEKLSTGSKKLASLWEQNKDLKEIMRLKEKILKTNSNILQETKRLSAEVESLEMQLSIEKKSKKDNKTQISDKLNLIMACDELISENQQKIDELKRSEKNNENKEETKRLKATNDKIKNEKKNEHGNVVYRGMEINNLEIKIQEIKNNIVRINLQKKEVMKDFDKFTEIYVLMEAVKKKEISEESILKIKSETYEELVEVNNIRKALSKSSIERLTVKLGNSSYPLEIIEISDRILTILDKTVQEKLKISGFSNVDKTSVIWSVLRDNIKLNRDLNTLKATISSDLLEATKKGVEEWDEAEAHKKQKIVNKILKKANIFEKITFENLTSKKKLKAGKKLKNEITVKQTKKVSNWRSCF